MDVGLDFKRSHLLNLVSILQIHLTVFDPARKFNQIQRHLQMAANGSKPPAQQRSLLFLGD